MHPFRLECRGLRRTPPVDAVGLSVEVCNACRPLSRQTAASILRSSLHRSGLVVARSPFFVVGKLHRSVPFLPHRPGNRRGTPGNHSRRGMEIDGGRGTGASCGGNSAIMGDASTKRRPCGGRLRRGCCSICRRSICRSIYCRSIICQLMGPSLPDISTTLESRSICRRSIICRLMGLSEPMTRFSARAGPDGLAC